MDGTEVSTAAPAAVSTSAVSADTAAATVTVFADGSRTTREETRQEPHGEGPLAGLTPRYIVRFAGAVVLFSASMHYLVSGRKEASLSKMFLGAVLAIASLLLL